MGKQNPETGPSKCSLFRIVRNFKQLLIALLQAFKMGKMQGSESETEGAYTCCCAASAGSASADCPLWQACNPIYFLQERAANAMEFNFVLVVSPREDKTQGTRAPTTMAATSPLQNLVCIL